MQHKFGSTGFCTMKLDKHAFTQHQLAFFANTEFAPHPMCILWSGLINCQKLHDKCTCFTCHLLQLQQFTAKSRDAPSNQPEIWNEKRERKIWFN